MSLGGAPRWEPVRDAATPCPECGAARWSATREVVACDVCGHAEELPAVADVALERVAPVIELDPDPLPALDVPAAADAGGGLPPEEFATARIAFHGPMAGDPRVAGTGWSGERLTSLTVRADGVCVTTEETGFPWGAGEAARQVLLEALPPRGAPPSGASIAAGVLWIAAMRRALEATAARAAIGERVVVVDGTPVTFTTAAADGMLGAVAALEGATITIAAPASAFPSVLRRLAAADVA
jgi:hypothetical protein